MRLATPLLLRHVFCLVILATAASTVMAQTRTQEELRVAIDDAIAKAGMPNGWWTVNVQDAETGAPLYERDTARSFIPASNTKLYSSAAALDILGPDYRFETEIWAMGRVENGILNGHLIIRGSGDPVIGGRFTDGDVTAYFRAWADSLKAAGITTIRGDIIGDDDAYDEEAIGYGWQYDDLPYWYAAELSALSFNDNAVDFRLEASTPGSPAILSWEPMMTSYVTARNASMTTEAGGSIEEDYFRPQGSNDFVLGSLVPAGRIDYESLSVANPTKYFLHALREVLVAQGITVLGKGIDIDDLSIKPAYAQMTHLFSHYSPSLAEIVVPLNKDSHNLYAEMALRAIAADHLPENGEPAAGSVALAVSRARKVFGRAGVDTLHIQLVDGSGLARQNLITSSMTTSLLRYMRTHPNEATQRAFIDSLPIGGVDGSLSSRMKGTAAAGNVQAKTGSMGNVSALAGYVTSASGRELVFSIMANNYLGSSSRPRKVQDEIVVILASHGN